LGARPFKIWEGKKRPKLSNLIANISRTGQYIENMKQISLRAIPAALNKKW